MPDRSLRLLPPDLVARAIVAKSNLRSGIGLIHFATKDGLPVCVRRHQPSIDWVGVPDEAYGDRRLCSSCCETVGVNIATGRTNASYVPQFDYSLQKPEE